MLHDFTVLVIFQAVADSEEVYVDQKADISATGQFAHSEKVIFISSHRTTLIALSFFLL